MKLATAFLVATLALRSLLWAIAPGETVRIILHSGKTITAICVGYDVQQEMFWYQPFETRNNFFKQAGVSIDDIETVEVGEPI